MYAPGCEAVRGNIAANIAPCFVRQVDRLEQEMAELRRSQEEQATAAAARARTTGVLEEYRTRTQQALKRANEITTQTASENKRLKASGVPCRRVRPSQLVVVALFVRCASTIVTGCPDTVTLTSIFVLHCSETGGDEQAFC